jgi:flagellar biosynthesis protein FlhG
MKIDEPPNQERMEKGKSGEVVKLKKDKKDGSSSTNDTPIVISVTSGKGGVGKTIVVGNLAIVFQRMGKNVLIFDADLGLANMDILFGIRPKHTIEDVIKGDKELSQIIVKGQEEVSLIPACSGEMELTHLSEGHKINLLSEFDILNSVFDILLIDTGAGISSNVVYFNLASQERLVVATPEPTSITNAYALMKVMYEHHETKKFFLLLNMVKDEGEAKAVYEHLSKRVAMYMGSISLDYAGFIPRDDHLFEAVSKREFVICSYPEAPSSRRFQVLAEYLMKHSNGRPHDGNIKFFWKRLMATMD